MWTGFQGSGTPQNASRQEEAPGELSWSGNQCCNLFLNVKKRSHTMPPGSHGRFTERGEKRGRKGGRMSP